MSARRQRARRQRLDVDVATLAAIVDRWRVAPIGEEESELWRSAIGTLAELTAELIGADPFDYVNSLLNNADHLEDQPGLWMPWNYRETLASLARRRVNDAVPAG
ncbi:hypothetical protein L6Q96_14480 [Candidatus Binatia bacterium]|nr:hypothetical protein [Candidatus Binatia bacterium]